MSLHNLKKFVGGAYGHPYIDPLDEAALNEVDITFGNKIKGKNKKKINYGNVLDNAKTYAPRCYESHPGLDIGGNLVYGGSCGHPAVDDADIYVGLDSSRRVTYEGQPWNAHIVEATFLIPDMGVPSNVPQFKKMIEWLAVQIVSGKKVHIGCIGGHGRTGTVLAALVKEITGEKDAITYVRKNYCEKAVESEDQINFLHEHYGITKVKSNKKHSFGGTGALDWTKGSTTTGSGRMNYEPVVSRLSVWGTIVPNSV